MEHLEDSNARLIEELNLVIQTDREAVEMVQNAYKTKLSIEQKTADERKAIAKEAQDACRALEERFAKEQELELQKWQEKAREEQAGARDALRDEMERNKESWLKEIYESILSPKRE